MSATWPKVRLREVLIERCEVPDQESLARGSIRIVSKIRFDVGTIELRQEAKTKTGMILVRPGDLLLSGINAAKGAIAIYSRDNTVPVAATIHYSAYSVVKHRADLVYMWWYLRSAAFRGILFESLPEGIKTELKACRLLPIEIPLPPLPAQRRIVARIAELAAQIHEAHTLRQQAVEEAEAMLASVSQRLFEPKAGWKMLAVGDFCEPPQYGYTESATDQPIGPRFLRITDIQDGQVEWERVPYCRCPEPSRYLLKPNDLVFARTGATTGKSFVIRDCPEAVFASYLIRLRVRDAISVDYLYRYFQSPSYWGQIADEKKGTGQPNLNGSKLEKLQVPIAPGSEQRHIVAELDALQAEVDKLKRLQFETSKELDALLPSILDRAFKGDF